MARFCRIIAIYIWVWVCFLSEGSGISVLYSCDDMSGLLRSLLRAVLTTALVTVAREIAPLATVVRDFYIWALADVDARNIQSDSHVWRVGATLMTWQRLYKRPAQSGCLVVRGTALHCVSGLLKGGHSTMADWKWILSRAICRYYTAYFAAS